MISQVRQRLQELADLYHTLTGQGVPDELWNCFENTFNIVVQGGVNKGKSTFINTLLGFDEGLISDVSDTEGRYNDIIPTSSQADAPCVYKLSYGEELTYTIHYVQLIDENSVQRIEPRRVTKAELTEYISGGIEDMLRIDHIAVTCNSPFLRHGVTIVDTPGVDSVLDSVGGIDISRHVNTADAVFYLLDHTAPLSARDKLEIINLLKINQQQECLQCELFIVQNKSLIPTLRETELRRENNLSIIWEEIWPEFDESHYFMLDAGCFKEGDVEPNELKLSGYLDLLQHCLMPRIVDFQLKLREQIAAIWKFVFDECGHLLKVVRSMYHRRSVALIPEVDSEKLKALWPIINSAYMDALAQSVCILRDSKLCQQYVREIQECQKHSDLKMLLHGTSDAPGRNLTVRLAADLDKKYQDIHGKFVAKILEAIHDVIPEFSLADAAIRSCGNVNAGVRYLERATDKRKTPLVLQALSKWPYVSFVISCCLNPILSVPVAFAGVGLSVKLTGLACSVVPEMTAAGLARKKAMLINHIRIAFDLSYSKTTTMLMEAKQSIERMVKVRRECQTHEEQSRMAQRVLNMNRDVLVNLFSSYNGFLTFFNTKGKILYVK